MVKKLEGKTLKSVESVVKELLPAIKKSLYQIRNKHIQKELMMKMLLVIEEMKKPEKEEKNDGIKKA
jgi:hypothetical protein